MGKLTIFIISLVLLLTAAYVAVIGCKPGGFLYAFGNVSSCRLLTAFGFNRPLPQGFLFPTDILLRWIPRTNPNDVATIRDTVVKQGTYVDIEYMSDQTFFNIWRQPDKELFDCPAMAEAELEANHPTDSKWPPTQKVITPQLKERPSISRRILAGYSYDCGERSYVETEGVGEFRVFVAIRKLKSVHQVLRVVVVTPGATANLDATKELLSCFSVE